jgi:hypothetical protein
MLVRARHVRGRFGAPPIDYLVEHAIALATVRPDGRPHVTPLIAIWPDGALYSCPGRGERKAQNLARNAHCVLTTGRNALHEGLDLVVEGDAARVRDAATRWSVAAGFAAKDDRPFRFTVRDGACHGEGGEAPVYAVSPTTAFASAGANRSALPAGASSRMSPENRPEDRNEQGPQGGDGRHPDDPARLGPRRSGRLSRFADVGRRNQCAGPIPNPARTRLEALVGELGFCGGRSSGSPCHRRSA